MTDFSNLVQLRQGDIWFERDDFRIVQSEMRAYSAAHTIWTRPLDPYIVGHVDDPE